jgi:hypothetical protein
MNKKRLSSALLIVIMILTMFPSSVFAADKILIRAGMRPEDGGDVPDSDYYPAGSVVTLTATPYPGYTFEYWYDYQDGIDFSTTDNPYREAYRCHH